MAFKLELGRRIVRLGAIAVLAVVVSPVPGRTASLAVTPSRVSIGTFFQGRWIRVRAPIPAGCQAVVEIVGRADEEDMMLKGRRLGLWMNVGEVDILGAPRLYLAASTEAHLLAADDQAAPWGYPSLARHMSFKGGVHPGGAPVLSREFFDLKKSQRLYGVFPGALTTTPGPDGTRIVQGRFRLPSRITPGDYQVHLTVVKDGRVLARRRSDLTVALAGFPSLLSNLAYGHRFLYGLLALVIAFGAGCLIGVVFRRGCQRH